MNKFWLIYAWGTIIIAFLTLILIGFWLFYPYKNLTFSQDTFPISNHMLSAGGVFTYTADYCKKGNFTTEVSRAFNDGVLYSMPSMFANNPSGCRTNNVVIETPNLPAGEYRLRIVYRYFPNPIRTIEIVKYTDIFTIVSNDVDSSKPVIYSPIIKNTIVVPTTVSQPTPQPTPVSKGKGK